MNAYRLCVRAQSLLRKLWILSAGEKKEYIGIPQDDCTNRNNQITKASNTILKLQYMCNMLEYTHSAFYHDIADNY